MRLAHFSDIHVTVPPLAYGGLGGKRLAGLANYYIGGRRHHFRAVDLRIERLLEDIERTDPDHVLCTGDITQMSYPAEFERAAELFGPRLARPDRFTVIPGNHDRYTRESVQTDVFGRHFGPLASPTGEYPYLKWLRPNEVALVLLDVTRSTGLLDSSGWCGPSRRAQLAQMLMDPSLESAFVIVALHYALMRPNGRPDSRRHGVRDDAELLELLDQPNVHVDLVLHGHMHQPYVVRSARRTIVCAGSATDLAMSGGWSLYEIDVVTKSVSLRRRVWSELASDYQPSGESISLGAASSV